MQALAYHEPRPMLKLRFIETAKARLGELDILRIKTECAIESIDHRYWSRRHRDTLRDIQDVIRINERVLINLRGVK